MLIEILEKHINLLLVTVFINSVKETIFIIF